MHTHRRMSVRNQRKSRKAKGLTPSKLRSSSNNKIDRALTNLKNISNLIKEDSNNICNENTDDNISSYCLKIRSLTIRLAQTLDIIERTIK